MKNITPARDIFDVIKVGLIAGASVAALALFRQLAGQMASVDFQRGAEALASFSREGNSSREFTSELKAILEMIAVTGNYWHNWRHLRSLLAFRLDQVLNQYNAARMAIEVGPPRPLKSGETFEELQRRLQQALESFVDGAPFTLQRLCELLLYPQATYPTLDNLALAFEKLLLVTSTIGPSKAPYPSLPLPQQRLQALSSPARRSYSQNHTTPPSEQNNHMATNTNPHVSNQDHLGGDPSEAQPMHIDIPSAPLFPGFPIATSMPDGTQREAAMQPQAVHSDDGTDTREMHEGGFKATESQSNPTEIQPPLAHPVGSPQEVAHGSVPPVTAADIGPQPRPMAEQLSPDTMLEPPLQFSDGPPTPFREDVLPDSSLPEVDSFSEGLSVAREQTGPGMEAPAAAGNVSVSIATRPQVSVGIASGAATDEAAGHGEQGNRGRLQAPDTAHIGASHLENGSDVSRDGLRVDAGEAAVVPSSTASQMETNKSQVGGEEGVVIGFRDVSGDIDMG